MAHRTRAYPATGPRAGAHRGGAVKPGGEALYSGEVVHARLGPRTHTLRYRVFSVMFDIDRLDTLDRRL
ncbi:MAG TPA: DUF1365 family protein, partial [Devosiaceae bacterium]|nr:DUF1365 family protein [Devosiaceae bacterium]